MAERDISKLTPGLEATVEAEVTAEDTAVAMGSGDVAVLATPMVAALVEGAAVAAVHAELPSGTTTVGVFIQVEHVAPTPVGTRVAATAVLEAVEGRRLRFGATVHDSAGEVATAIHERVMVDRARFEARAASRFP